VTQIAQEFRDKVAFVTGGGRGFGKAFGRSLAEQGARVVLADIDVAVAEEAARELRQGGANVLALRCDVADELEVTEAMSRTKQAFGALDILINNAGLHSSAYNRPFAELGMAKLRHLFDVNVMGMIGCTLAAREAMLGRKNASVINISSVGGYQCLNAYGVSKLAVRGVTAAFARDFKSDGIRVNAIAPGLIMTDTIRAELPQHHIDLVKNQQIVNREGEEADVIAMMLFLASSRSSFITGETFRVSGGFTLQV
jgi:NAD(P)-dependent dehydrogenase (short-subunit alcohol dehydrogenase family)